METARRERTVVPMELDVTDVSRLAFIFLPSAALAVGVLFGVAQFKQQQIVLLRRAVVTFGVLATVAMFFLIATNFGSTFETIEVRNDSSSLIDIADRSGSEFTLSQDARGEVDAVNGVDEIRVALPDGRVVKFEFFGKKRGEDNLLTITDITVGGTE